MFQFSFNNLGSIMYKNSTHAIFQFFFYTLLTGRERVCQNLPSPENVSSRSSPCSTVFSDDGKDYYDFQLYSPLNVDCDFQLTPELTRLDMASSAIDWLENLDSSLQTEGGSQTNVAEDHQRNMMTSYRNAGVDCQVGAAVTFFNPVQPRHAYGPSPTEVATFECHFSPHSYPKDRNNLDSVDCVSDQKWKRSRYSVPDECKDEKYWRNRSRNNMSARKSRQAKRDKDRLVARKMEELEKENAMLKMMLANFMVQHQRQQQRSLPWQ